MATTNNHEISAFARSLSELKKTKNFLDPNTYVEVSKIESSSTTKSYKTTLRAMDEALIDTFDLYNNLNDIFTPHEHLNETYFGKDTTFAANPYVHKENNVPNKNDTRLFDSLNETNLITKKAIDEYLRDTGICVPICSPKSDYYYYSADNQIWIKDNKKIPMVMDYQKDGIWTSNSKVKFNYGTNYYYFTDEVEAPKNIMLYVTGNIVLSSNYSEKWYETQHYFAGLTLKGKLATMVFLKNILKIKNPTKDNSYYTIAQFHFNCPLADGAKFRIITNANCKLFGMSKTDVFTRKLYDSLNAVNLSYYDYGNVSSDNYETSD
jgi:hypothetical protein